MKSIAPAALAALCLSACEPVRMREEFYSDGTRKSREAFVIRNGDTLRQGLRITWRPDGTRESLEAYQEGRLQGYALRWHANGRMESVRHYSAGEPDGQAKYWDADGVLAACYDAAAGDCLRATTADAAIADEGAGRVAARP